MAKTATTDWSPLKDEPWEILTTEMTRTNSLIERIHSQAGTEKEEQVNTIVDREEIKWKAVGSAPRSLRRCGRNFMVFAQIPANSSATPPRTPRRKWICSLLLKRFSMYSIWKRI